MSLFKELKRRNVFRVGGAYLVVAWLVLQVSDVVLNNIGAPDWVFRVLLLILGIGLPLVLAFSWVLELTPEGLRLEPGEDPSRPIPPTAGRRLDRVIIAGLVGVVLFMVAERLWFAGQDTQPRAAVTETVAAPGATPGRQAGAEDQSVAVLPFAALSTGEDDSYFADGLTEEIINALSALPELKVTARTSAFHFKGQDLPVPEMAARLGVAHIVEGSVRRSPDRVRITAQLVRAADGFHMWSNTYDRTLEDVFAVQEDIASKVAESLDILLDDEQLELMRRAGIGNVEAFIAYQKGREAFALAHQDFDRVTELLEGANSWFDTALELEPSLVSARILKTDHLTHLLFDFASGRRSEAYEGEARQTLAALSEEYEQAWSASPPGVLRDTLDVERAIFRDNWNGIRTRIERSLQPADCPEENWANETAILAGYIEEVLAVAKEAWRCSPYDASTVYNLAFNYTWAGDFERAIATTQGAEQSGIQGAWVEDAAFLALLAAGDLRDPRLRLEGSQEGILPFPREILYQALAGEAERTQELAEAFWASPDSNDWSALRVAVAVGDRRRANQHAARIDAWPGSTVVLITEAFLCLCGAPFDLEATPNFAARLSEGEFDWPPPTRIRYPRKDW